MGEAKAKQQLELLLKKVQQDSDVLAVMLFGSVARGESSAQSDVDICLVLYPKRWQLEELARKRWEYFRFDLDIKIFQQLPLYVRRRVLKEGIVLLVKDEDQLYELAFRTAKEFEDFKHIYRDYLEAIARG
ncbi:MAG: nucleotidyltransferase domain-containing protein [Candidatus Fervidibacter sacchari]|jgi:Nucleotidyltransferase domain.